MGNFLPNRNNNASPFFAPTYVTLGDPVQTEGEPQISVPFDRHELIACDPSGSAGTGAAGPGVAYPAPGEGREVWPRRRSLHALNPPEIRSVPNQPPPQAGWNINTPCTFHIGLPVRAGLSPAAIAWMHALPPGETCHFHAGFASFGRIIPTKRPCLKQADEKHVSFSGQWRQRTVRPFSSCCCSKCRLTMDITVNVQMHIYAHSAAALHSVSRSSGSSRVPSVHLVSARGAPSRACEPRVFWAMTPEHSKSFNELLS